MSYSAISLTDGEFVYRRGEDGDCMYLVQEGAVEMLDGGDDGVRLTLFERGDFFGETAVLDQVERDHTIRATEASRLIRVDGSGLAHMLRRNPEIAVRMIRKLGKRLYETEARLYTHLHGIDGSGRGDGSQGPRGRLVFEGDDGTRLLYEISGETVSIGRADPMSGIEPDVDLTPIDPKMTTSRRHAAISFDGSAFHIVELRATNGTFVNGVRLQPENAVRLLGGEQVVIGGVVMRFELVA